MYGKVFNVLIVVFVIIFALTLVSDAVAQKKVRLKFRITLRKEYRNLKVSPEQQGQIIKIEDEILPEDIIKKYDELKAQMVAAPKGSPEKKNFWNQIKKLTKPYVEELIEKLDTILTEQQKLQVNPNN